MQKFVCFPCWYSPTKFWIRFKNKVMQGMDIWQNAAGAAMESVLSQEPHLPLTLESFQRNFPQPPLRSRQHPSQPQSPGRQTTDLNVVFKVALLLLFTLLNIPCIRLQPVLTRGIPRHCRHRSVLLPLWGSGYLISPWVLLSNTFSNVGETWRETHCQVQVTHACNHPPASQAQIRAPSCQQHTGELWPIFFS